MSLNGTLTSNWNIGLGHTYVKSKYAEGEEKGDPYDTQAPKHMFRAFTTCHVPGTGWTVGGNIRAQSDAYSTDNVYLSHQAERLCLGGSDGEIPDQPVSKNHRHSRQPVRQEILVSEQRFGNALRRTTAVCGEFEVSVLRTRHAARPSRHSPRPRHCEAKSPRQSSRACRVSRRFRKLKRRVDCHVV